MKRRDFIKRLAGGIVGTAVVLNIDVPTVIDYSPSWLKDEAALSYLRRLYNQHLDLYKRPPEFIVADRDLYEAAEAEMNVLSRFTSESYHPAFQGPRLWFRATLMYQRPSRGYRAEFVRA